MKKETSHWVYAKNEMKWMMLFQDWKEKVLKPLVRICKKLWITPNWLTIFWWIIVAASVVISLQVNNPYWFIWWVWIHLFIDWLDGTVARALDISTPEWTFLDVIMDHVWIVSSCIFLLTFSTIPSRIILLYWIFYTIVIACSLVLWKINDPYWLILRPRILVYLLITVTSWIYLERWVLFFTLLLWIHTRMGLRKLFNYHKTNKND